MNRRHGSPYDRGAADSYYQRPFNPHYFTGATYSSDRVNEEQMTPEEIAEYRAGWQDNEASQNFKDWN